MSFEVMKAEINLLRVKYEACAEFCIKQDIELQTLRNKLKSIEKLPRINLQCGDGGMYSDQEPDGEWVEWEGLAKILEDKEDKNDLQP